MSLLSKLLGKAGSELGLDKLVKTVTDAAHQAAGNAPKPETHRPAEPRPAAPTPLGRSWGETMPAEENQFNYNGTYDRYFEEIFRTEFSAYRLERQDVPGGRRVIFTFWDGARKALVVELLNQSSDSQKLRRDCRASGVPYLRYYYDHEGWWNTRSYVVDRTRKALEG
jgi:hypothetical protein